jgi:hypothetical protein
VISAESRPTVSNCGKAKDTIGPETVAAEDVAYHAPVNFPTHERLVEVWYAPLDTYTVLCHVS